MVRWWLGASRQHAIGQIWTNYDTVHWWQHIYIYIYHHYYTNHLYYIIIKNNFKKSRKFRLSSPVLYEKGLFSFGLTLHHSYIATQLYFKHSRVETLLMDRRVSRLLVSARTDHGHVESRRELKTRVKVKAVDWRVPVSNEVRPWNQSKTLDCFPVPYGIGLYATEWAEA